MLCATSNIAYGNEPRELSKNNIILAQSPAASKNIFDTKGTKQVAIPKTANMSVAVTRWVVNKFVISETAENEPKCHSEKGSVARFAPSATETIDITAFTTLSANESAVFAVNILKIAGAITITPKVALHES